ncbi:hypothetical protein EV702DRAFT_1042600 [Suillus placidus]|uniref:Uncharacterized protein n=1 Tax=Suillus placidus TaxID=48579 RepID=A0A9P7A253_9AGAM|nr:hypothetical protein EV702DRAFT_1042600 [Suillus placidus]
MYNPMENFGVEEHFGLRNPHLDTTMMIVPSPRYTPLKVRMHIIREQNRKYYARQTLAECLAILKDTKDVFVSLVKSPAKFAQGVLKKFLDTIPDDAAETHMIQKGDITIIQDTINSIKDLHCEVHRGLDTILEMCGVCDEWKAGNDICQSMSMLGVTEIAIAYEMGELMYQRKIIRGSFY